MTSCKGCKAVVTHSASTNTGRATRGPTVFSRPGLAYSVPENAGAPPDPHFFSESRELFFSLNSLQTYLARERERERERDRERQRERQRERNTRTVVRRFSSKEGKWGWVGGVGTHLQKTWGDPRLLAPGGASGCQVLHFS